MNFLKYYCKKCMGWLRARLTLSPYPPASADRNLAKQGQQAREREEAVSAQLLARELLTLGMDQ